MKTSATATAFVLASALTLAGCDSSTEQEASGTSGSPVGEAADGTTAPDDDASATTAPPAASGVPELVPVEWADAPRELTDVEQEFMYVPGPYAGDAYDEDAAYEAILAMEPQSAQEWQRAIQSQVQDDYAEDVKAAILFDPTLSDRGAEPTEGEAPEAETVGSNHFAIVLDASGSMAAEATSGSRMTEAKAAIAEFVDTLPEGSTVSLRIYGHEGDNTDAGRPESCESSEVVFEGDAAGSGLGETLDDVEPVGWTPLTRAVQDSADDIPQDATDGIVYVVTDGLESCGGDPVQAAQDLAGSGVEPIVNVIGFEVGDADQQALRAMAEAGGGEFTAVGSGADLEEYWDEEYARMRDAWSEWQRVELQRITNEGQENMAEATEVGQRLMNAATDEGEHAMALATRLGNEDVVDYDTGNELWNWAYNRQNDMWNWAYDRHNSNWSAAYDETNLNWQDVYDTGNDKWSEYYRKQVGD